MKAYTSLALALVAVPALVQPALAESKMDQLVSIYQARADLSNKFMDIVGDLAEKKTTADEAAKVIAQLAVESEKVEKARLAFDASLSEKEIEKLYGAFAETELSDSLGEIEHGVGNSWEELKAAQFYKSAALEKACKDFLGNEEG